MGIPLLWRSAGGQQALLEGSASCSAVAAGSLTTGIALAGAAADSATAVGEITTEIRLAGAAQDSVAAAGDLSTQIPLAGSAQDAATAAGDLATAIRLSGEAAGAATAEADLTAPQQILLEGSAVCSLAVSGELTVPQPAALLEGSANCTLTAEADLTAPQAQPEPSSGGGLAWIGRTIRSLFPREQKREAFLLKGSARCSCAAQGELTTGVALKGSAALSIRAAGEMTNSDLDAYSDDDLVMMLMQAAFEERVLCLKK